MLHRIWGRTSSRSSNRNLPHFEYSPLGPIEYLSPHLNESQTSWVTQPGDFNTALTLIGYALLNQRIIRIHGDQADVDLLKTVVNDRLPALSQSQKLPRVSELSHEFASGIESWQRIYTGWANARTTLEQITFGALNSLEVLQSILKTIQYVPTHLFHDVSTSTFSWTNEEYRLVEQILQEWTTPRQKLFARFDQLDIMHIHATLLLETPVEETRNRIRHWQEDLEALSQNWSVLTGRIHRKFRQQTDVIDWSQTWKELERSTVNRFQDDPDLRDGLAQFTEQIDQFSQSVQTSGLLTFWNGFQSISFAEINQEIRQIRHRFERLLGQLDELREIAGVKTWFSSLPPPAREILKGLADQDLDIGRSAFSVWYLSRWIEFQTPSAAWIQLAGQDQLSNTHHNLLQLAHRWLQYIGQTTETRQWSDWVVDARSRGATLRHSAAAQTLDLYLDPALDTEKRGIAIQPTLTGYHGPELDRLNRLMADTPTTGREELPSPLHRHQAFWSPSELVSFQKDHSSLPIAWSSNQVEEN